MNWAKNILFKSIMPFALVFLLTNQTAQAQTYQWLKTLNGPGRNIVGDFDVDDNGNQYLSIRLDDSLTLDSHVFYKNKNLAGASTAILLVKQDKDGKFLWGKTINCRSNVTPWCSSFDSKGNFVILGESYGNPVYFSATDSAIGYTSKRFLFLARYDSLGNYLDSRSIVKCINNSGIFWTTTYMSISKTDELYLGFKSDTVRLSDAYHDTLMPLISNYDYSIFKFSNLGEKFLWRKNLMTGMDVKKIQASNDGNLIVGGYREQNYMPFLFAGDTVKNPKDSMFNNAIGTLFIYASNGQEINHITIEANTNLKSYIYTFSAYNSQEIYISGYAGGDSVKFGNDWKTFQTGNLRHFFGSINASGNVNWLRKADQFHNLPYCCTKYYHLANSFLDSFIYLSYYSQQPITNLSYETEVIGSAPARVVTMKFDNLGNILWGYKSRELSFTGIDRFQNCYFSGSYRDTIQFGQYTIPPVYPLSTTQEDAYITKTYDYAIHRGDLSKGPYCSGDTIQVPYIKIGEFDTSNYFIAELSDEYGNYFGDQIEIGRIKSDDSDTIRAVIPRRYTAGSSLYRIRVRSTSPTAQNYFFRDSLRLLIYSSDSADAGGDEYLCKGDTLSIQTFGGTSWSWSPDYHMENPNARKTRVWPDTTTTYRIAISDSSGCGVIDTAYKRILIRQPPEITGNVSDSLICNNEPFRLRINGENGDSTYLVRWLHLGTPTTIVRMKNLIGTTDSLDVQLTNGDTAGQAYKAIITDKCSRKADTVLMRLRSSFAPKLFLSTTDTTLCYNGSLQVNASSLGGLQSQTQFIWHETQLNTYDTGHVLLLDSIQQHYQYTVFVDDGCHALDSLLLNVSLYWPNPIAISPSQIKDSLLLCDGKMESWYNVRDTTSTNPQRSWEWTFSNMSLSTDSIFTFQSSDLHTFAPNEGSYRNYLKLLQSDACASVTDSVLIHLYPPVQVKTNADTQVCPGQNILLASGIHGGDSTKYSYHYDHYENGVWRPLNLGNQDTLNWTSPIHQETGKTDSIRVLASDGCSLADTAQFAVSYYDPIQSALTPMDTLLCEETSFQIKTNLSGGSGNPYHYRWYDENYMLLDSSPELSVVAKRKKLKNEVDSQYVYLIIDDGCMPLFDTLVNRFRIRSLPEISLLDQAMPNGDTLICQETTLNLEAEGNEGYQAGYQFTWFTDLIQNPPTEKFAQSSRWIKQNATLQNGAYPLGVILNDACNLAPDTLKLRVFLRDSLQTTLLIQDSLCVGETLLANTRTTGGIPSDYRFTWSINQQNVSTDSSLMLSFIDSKLKPGTNRLTLHVEDGCSFPEVSVSRDLFLRDSLAASLSSTYPCAIPDIPLIVTISGGKTNAYSFEIRDSNQTLLSTTSPYTHQSQSPESIYLMVEDGCTQYVLTDTFDINLKPQVQYLYSDTAFCFPKPLLIEAEIRNGTAARHFLKSGNRLIDSFESTYQLTLNQGEYTFQIIARTDAGCEASSKLQKIRVWPHPYPEIQIDPESPDWNTETLWLKSSEKDNWSYAWTVDLFGTGTESSFPITVQDSGHIPFQLIVTNEYGCADTLVDTVYVREGINYYFPNAFSPNGDRYNPTFKPVLTGIDSYTIYIYNRWGALIFSGDQDHHWDGTYEGIPVQEGTFLFTITMHTSDNERIVESGTISLFR